MDVGKVGSAVGGDGQDGGEDIWLPAGPVGHVICCEDLAGDDGEIGVIVLMVSLVAVLDG